MASITIRSTYALDEETVQRLANLARRWNVSKSEALRKAIRAADTELPGNDRLAALDELQKSIRLTAAEAESWATLSRQERRASSKQRASGKRRASGR